MNNLHEVEPLLTETQAAEFLRFTTRFLQSRRIKGNGPPFVRVSHRAIRYRKNDLDNWVDSLVRKSTSEHVLKDPHRD